MNEGLVQRTTNLTDATVETLDLTPSESTDKVALSTPVNESETEEELYEEIEYIASEEYIKKHSSKI